MQLHPLIVEGLKILGEKVNLTDGLAHPNDKEKAVELLLALYEEDLPIKPDLVAEWCSQNNWPPKAVNEIYLIAFTLKAVLNRKLRGRVPRFFSPDIIKQLRSRIQSG